jgi:ribosome biogenesis protein ERB1
MKGKKAPMPEPEPESEEVDEEEESGSSGDNEESTEDEEGSDAEEEGSKEEGSEEEDGDEFEDQGSSSDDEETLAAQAEASDGDDDDDEGSGGNCKVSSAILTAVEEEGPRHWSIRSKEVTVAREHELAAKRADGRLAVEVALHVDDLSSDDEAAGNTIGQVPLRWYEDYDHIGYDVHGAPIGKKDKVSGLDRAIAGQDDPSLARRTVYDALNDTEVVLTDRDLEIIRRIQSGAYAHPEHEAHPAYIPYYSEVDKHVMPLSERDLPKRRFVPSK